MSNVSHVELHVGSLGVVYAVRCSDGSCPAEEFLAGLDVRAQTQFMARFERLADGHGLISPDHYRQLHVAGLPAIWEIKVHAGPGLALGGGSTVFRSNGIGSRRMAFGARRTKQSPKK